MSVKESNSITYSSLAVLDFRKDEESFDFNESMELVSESSELFLRMASLLPEDQFLGWQFDARSGRCIVLSTPEADVSVNDIGMVFRKIADIHPEGPAVKPTLAGKGRKIYCLIPDEKKDLNISKRESFLLGSRFGLIASDRYWDALRILSERKAIIRFIAGRDGGKIYVSVPGKMSLDLQVMLTLLFPNLKAAWVLEETALVTGMPYIEAMSSILFSRYFGRPFPKPSNPDEIEELDLDMGFGEDAEAVFEAADFRSMLQDLIGLEDIKEQIGKIEAFARLKKSVKEKGEADIPIALNMEFTGNPGTAKTTIARILAGILAEVGLIEDPHIYEVGRSDLVGRYVGETACKVKDVFRKAEGRILFIDEAYSLVDDRDGSYGDEAINTIVQEMENRRDRTIVIFAGYPDKMREFFSINPGLRSRVPFSLRFPDYSVEQMEQIVELEANKRGFTIDKDAMSSVRAACVSASGDTQSGNGRFARNLVENAILEYASRIYREGKAFEERILMAEDFSYVYRPNKRTNRIGF